MRTSSLRIHKNKKDNKSRKLEIDKHFDIKVGILKYAMSKAIIFKSKMCKLYNISNINNVIENILKIPEVMQSNISYV